MKKFFLSLLILAIAVLTLNATNINEARAKAYIAARIFQNAGYRIGGLKGEYLSQGGYRTYSRYLYSNIRYLFLGAGDSTVRDLDVQVYDRNWNLITSDNDTANVSAVEFYPPHTGTYYIRTKMYSGHGYFFQIVGWK